MPREVMKEEVTITQRRSTSKLPMIILGVVMVGSLAAMIALAVLYSQAETALVQKDKEISDLKNPTTIVPGVPTTPGPVAPLTYRLPRSLDPREYDLSLKVYLPFDASEENNTKAFTTEGKVIITLVAREAVSEIVYHSSIDQFSGRINYAKENVRLERNGTAVVVNELRFENQAEVARLVLAANLEVNATYQLTIDFTGKVAADNQGLYRSSYVTPAGTKRWLAATQFQPYKARRLFPCFDEPGFRSVVKTTLQHDKRFTMTRSNGVGTSVEEATTDGITWMKTTFTPTPKMPVYLMAFLISDFGILSETATTGNFSGQVTILAQQRLLDAAGGAQGAFGLQQAKIMIEHLNDNFSQPYFEHIAKLDNAAIPDFDAGAMENYGLVLYRESRLLYHSGVSSADDKRSISAIVGHELAHMLFGNLVTCDWWSDTWLNEGFARFFQHELMYTAKPEWDLEKLFPFWVTRVAFESDSLETAHPLHNPNTNTLAEISTMFDTVTYSKGGSILNMIMGIMTRPRFYAALTRYLAEYKLGNVVHGDLLKHFTQEMQNEGINFAERLDVWVNKAGYPVLELSVNNQTGAITYKQKRFLFRRHIFNESDTLVNSVISNLPNTTMEIPADQDHVWHIPLTIQRPGKSVDDGKKQICWITERQGNLAEACKGNNTLDLPTTAPGAVEWILANVAQHGFYRVNYDWDTWHRLFHQLETKHDVIDETNRGQIIDDAFNLARSGQFGVDYGVALHSTRWVANETQYGPLASAFAGLNFISRMLRLTSHYQNMKTYVQRLVRPAGHPKPLYSADDWEDDWVDQSDEDYNLVMRRRLILENACKFELKECLDDAYSRFELWRLRSSNFSHLSTGESIVNTKGPLLCYGIRQSNADAWEDMLQQYLNRQLPTVTRLALLRALACSLQADLLVRLLDLTLNLDNTEPIAWADVSATFSYVTESSPIGESVAWEFVQNNWPRLRGSKTGILTNVAGNFRTPARYFQLRNLFNAVSATSPQEVATFRRLLAQLEANTAWYFANYETITQYFQQEINELEHPSHA